MSLRIIVAILRLATIVHPMDESKQEIIERKIEERKKLAASIKGQSLPKCKSDADREGLIKARRRIRTLDMYIRTNIISKEERGAKNAKQRKDRKRRNEAMSTEERKADFERRKAYKDKYYEENCEKIKEKMRKDYASNPDKFIERSRRHYEKNRDEILKKCREEWAANRIEPTADEVAAKRAESDRLRKIRNERYKACPIRQERRRVAKRLKTKNLTGEERAAKNEYQRRYMAKRLKEDVIFKLRHTLSRSIRRAVFAQSAEKKRGTNELTGCDWNFLRAYLEARFTDEMSWDNHGSVWHIDHVKPVSSFDLTKESEQRKCCHYTNLQPLLAFDNISKSNKMEVQQELF